MFLFTAVIVLLASLGYTLLVLMANSMSDAPSVEGITPWGGVIGVGIALVMIAFRVIGFYPR